MVAQVSDQVAAGSFIEAAGVRTHYNELGSGPAVICLHGGGPGASGWSNFRPNLPALAAGHRTLLLDSPGYGQSDVPPDGLTNWDHLAGFMDAVGVEQATLIGNSLGGATALRFASKYPQRVEKLVLMGVAAIGPIFSSTRPTIGIDAIQEFFRGEPSKDKLRRIFSLIVYRPEQFLTDEILEERYQAAIRPDALAWRQQQVGYADRASAAGANFDVLAACTKLTAPTLLIWGTEDRFNPVETGLQLVKLIPGSRLYVFSECGHWAQLERADEFNRLVADFLEH